MENSMNISFAKSSDESYHNLIGSCGIRPVGMGKKHREKLADWESCRKQAREDKHQKKQAKIAIKNAKAHGKEADIESGAANDDLINKLADEPAPKEEKPSGMGMPAMIGIGLAVALLIGGAVMMMSKKVKPAAAAAA